MTAAAAKLSTKGRAVNKRSLPGAGLAFGQYPQRGAPARHWWGDTLRAAAAWLQPQRPARLPPELARACAALQADLAAAAAEPECWAQRHAQARQAVATALQCDGFSPASTGAALGLVSATMAHTLGRTPYPTQLLAAWLMLQGRLAEMATGEGKTLAAALAAGVAALAEVPVHVITANDYLAQRDQAALLPLYRALGLSSGLVLATTPADQRAVQWRRAIVHTTAKELGFDYLRDHVAHAGERDPRVLRARELTGRAPVPQRLPGLCMAIVDEADSLLLDEACMPLILAAPGPAVDEAAHRLALQLAYGLIPGRDHLLRAAERRAQLTPIGRDHVAQAVRARRGLQAPVRAMQELVETALVACHLLRRDRDYAVTPNGLALIDELTGRLADGRQWSGALHALVQLKEGLTPSAPHVTAAQITHQRLFPRYLQLAGMSGSLRESRHELRALYGSAVALVPPARPSQRRWLGTRLYRSAELKWAAVLAAVQAHKVRGQPVLVGTDSVAASAALSARLQAAGIEHQLLNAVQDADEAAQVARAGQHGVVTIATNIAGRGTDIQLDAAARAAGGLHVIAALCNRSRRIDRQLIGRCARHGDPGSAERIASLDDPLLARHLPRPLRRLLQGGGPGRLQAPLPAWLAGPLLAWPQRLAEWQDLTQRRALRAADLQHQQACEFAGLPE